MKNVQSRIRQHFFFFSNVDYLKNDSIGILKNTPIQFLSRNKRFFLEALSNIQTY